MTDDPNTSENDASPAREAFEAEREAVEQIQAAIDAQCPGERPDWERAREDELRRATWTKMSSFFFVRERKRNEECRRWASRK